MEIEVHARRSRRNLLTAVGAAVAGAVAASATSVQRVLAAGDDDKTIQIGHSYLDVRSTTHMQSTNGRSLFALEAAGAGSAINAFSSSGDGLSGQSNGTQAAGVRGENFHGPAVVGTSDTSFKPSGLIAVYGHSTLTNGIGVQGESSDSIGVAGMTASPDSFGVYGYATADSGGIGVYGRSDNAGTGAGVWGQTSAPHGVAVHGQSDSFFGIGVRGRAPNGRGGVFAGSVAQLRLVPSNAASHPSGGLSGDLFLDKAGRLWLCLGGTSWKRVQLV